MSDDDYREHKRRAAAMPMNPYGTAAPPSARVLPQVSPEAAEVIQGSGGIFHGAWQRYLVGMGLRSAVTPEDMLRNATRGLFDAGREISQAYEDSREAYGMDPPASATGIRGGFRGAEVERWRGYRDAGADFGRVGDAETILRGMDPGMVARLQDRLVSAGFMSGGAFAVGSPVDDKTVDGFRGLLGYANSQGRNWEAALGEVERIIEETGIGGADDDRAPWVAPTYVAPDYATLAQTVKDHLRKTLGREADESELALFTAELSGWDREAFDAEVEAAKAEYDAREAGRSEAPTVESVDPLARFKEAFEQRYRAEIRGNERQVEAQETGEIVRGAVSNLSQMSGGLG